MDLASPAVSGTSVYANGLTYDLNDHDEWRAKVIMLDVVRRAGTFAAVTIFGDRSKQFLFHALSSYEI